MNKKLLSVLITGLFGLVVTCKAYATIITYNFTGGLTSISDPSSLLDLDRNFQVGDIFQAVYRIDTNAPMTSGAIGGGPLTNSSFTSAILNFQFYVNNISLVNSSYRFQTFRNINGMINGNLADWIEITTYGGIDNYNNSYGENSYGEYIDSRLTLVDLTGTALDSYNRTSIGNIPLSFDMDNFTFGNVSIFGESSTDSSVNKYQIRGDITSFSNNGFIPVPITEPSSLILFGVSLIGLGFARKKY